MSTSMAITGGTAASPIVYMAYPGEKVVFDWSAQPSDGIRADTLSYWTLDGVYVKGSANGYGIAEQQYSAVSNVTLRNVETTGWYDAVFFMNNMANTLIERSVFHDLSTYGEHNLYIGASANTSPNLIFRNNIVYKAGMGGGHNLHLNGRFPNALVQGNIFYADLNQCIGIQMGINHSTFENNICFTSSNAPIFLYDYYQASVDTDIQAYDQNYNTFRNNTFYYDGTDYTTGNSACNQYAYWVRDDSGGSGSVSNPTNATHDLGHNTYDNNIFYTGCTGSGAAMRYDTDSNGNGGSKWLATDTWRNNIFYSAGGGYGVGFLALGNQAQSGLTGMTFAQFQAGTNGGSTNMTSDPKLGAVNPAWANSPQNFNLQPQAGSPAIGGGLATDAPAVDIMGKTRGSKPDIGAYQSSGGGTAPALAIGTSSLAGGTAGKVYSQALSASGGTAPYTWSIVSGSLPGGLNLTSGTIGGTPSAAGSFSFTVQAADSAAHTATAGLSITIAAAAPVAALSSLSCGASSLASNGATTCTVSLTAAAPAAGLTVAISSNNTLLTVPASVTVSSGSSSGAFTAQAGTITAGATAVVTASYSGVAKTASISLTAPVPVAALSAVSCGASSLSSNGSTICTASMTTAAPAGGASVSLSSNCAPLTVPASVMVAAGTTAATFTAASGTVSASQTGVITANYSGVAKTASISLTAPAPVAALSAVSCGASSLASGGTTSCTVSLTAAAPAGGAPVALSSSSALLTVPASLTVASGSSSGSFTATAGTIAAGTTAVVTANYSGVAKTASISLTAPVPVAAALSAVSCGASSLASNGTTTCTVSLTAAAPASGASVALSSSSTLLTVPASLTVASGSTSGAFTAKAGTITAGATAVVTANYSGVAKTASISLTAPAPVVPAVSSLQCTPTTLASGAVSKCTVSVAAAAGTGGAAIAVSSNNALLTVPASVTVAAGATSTTFNSTAGTIAAGASAIVTATAGGASKTASFTLQAPVSGGTPPASGAFTLQGIASEVTGTTNGATVNPTAGFAGKLTVRGTGSVNFPAGGASFKTGGQQNNNTAFYTFTGAQVGSTFNVPQGQINFNLQSSYSFAARQALPQYNYRQVFDVFDNGQELFFFQVQAVWGRMSFYYNMGGTAGQTFLVPTGMEDTLFGAGTAMKVQMTWDGTSMSLYLNGTLVNKTAYTKATPNWTSTSSFTLGANDPHAYGGGYYSCDDIIGGFQVKTTSN